jgi:hypothetical protein
VKRVSTLLSLLLLGLYFVPNPALPQDKEQATVLLAEPRRLKEKPLESRWPGGRISGEYTVGMASIFHYAAARILLMNLWSVAEAASGTVPQPRLFGTCGS